MLCTPLRRKRRWMMMIAPIAPIAPVSEVVTARSVTPPSESNGIVSGNEVFRWGSTLFACCATALLCCSAAPRGLLVAQAE